MTTVCPGTVPHIPVQPHAALDQQVDSSWCLQVPVEVNTRQMGILLDNLGAQQITLHFHYSEHSLQPHISKSKKVQCLKVARVAVLQSRNHRFVPVQSASALVVWVYF